MKRMIFQDFYREEKTPHLWLYFFFSLVIHLIVFRVAMDTPMEVRMPDTRNQQEAEAQNQRPPIMVKKTDMQTNAKESPAIVQTPAKQIQQVQSRADHEAQAGRIEGVVTIDKQNVVVGMEIVAVPVDVETGAVYRAVTDGDGEYEFAQLPEGSYNIEVNSPAFHRELEPPVKVMQGAPIILNLEIIPENSSQSVAGVSPPSEPVRISAEEYRKLFENPAVQAFQQAVGNVMARVDRNIELDIEAMLRQLWFQEMVGDLLLFLEDLAAQLQWLGRRIGWLFFNALY